MATPGKRLIVKPPDKGSFPLDHDGECKESQMVYMKCLRRNQQQNEKCRHEAQDYLACRMDKNLMAKESWSKLGYKDLEDQTGYKLPEQAKS